MNVQIQDPPILRQALELEALGFWVVAIHPAGAVVNEKVKTGKEPIGFDWGVERRDQRWLRWKLGANPSPGIGVCFGPGRAPGARWLADIEGDGEKAGESFRSLMGGVELATIGWRSVRGGHNLFSVDADRLLGALTAAGAVEGKGNQAGVFKMEQLPDLEFRIGGLNDKGVPKQLQSVVPPTPGTDGKDREWVNPPTAGVAGLPEQAYVFLEALAAAKRPMLEPSHAEANGKAPEDANGVIEDDPWEMTVPPPSELSIEERAGLYLDKIDPAIQGQNGSDVTFRAACEMARFGLPMADGFRLMKDRYNPRCVPPWSEQELWHKLEGAYDAEQNKGSRVNTATKAPKRKKAQSATQRGSAQACASGQRPVILVEVEEHKTIDEAIGALAAESNLFQRGGSLVSVLAECRPVVKSKITRPAGNLRIVTLPNPQIRRLLTVHAEWVKAHKIASGGFEMVPTRPPTFAVEGVATMGLWNGIRPLEGIVETPTLRPDGSLLDQPGYDAETGLWFAPTVDFPKVPDNPSLADAQKAMGSLLAIVDDFPFAKPEYAATWLAALLTALARFAIDGCVPLFLFDANCPGTGKSKLCDIIAILTTGREMPRGSYPDDQDEMQKMLLSVAMAGDRLLLFDNVATGFSIGGSALDRAVTARTMKGRILGRSEMTSELPMNVVFFVTGNNLGIKGDALRRVVPCPLETTEERPEERKGFSISGCGCGCVGNLLAHVKINRGQLVCSALTILRAYIAAGKPDQALTPMDFPEWSGLIRNAVNWVTTHDPCKGRVELITNDEETNARRTVVEGWAALCADLGRNELSVADALAQLDHATPQYAGLRTVFCEWSKDGSLPSAKTVGRRFLGFKGRPVNGKALRSSISVGITQWYVKAV